MSRVVKVRSWDELPDVVKPGTYVIGGSRVVVREVVSKDVLKRLVRFGKYFSSKYGPSD